MVQVCYDKKVRNPQVAQAGFDYLSETGFAVIASVGAVLGTESLSKTKVPVESRWTA